MKYRLTKDLPWAKAGTVFLIGEWNDPCGTFLQLEEDGAILKDVHGNPKEIVWAWGDPRESEWFEKVEDKAFSRSLLESKAYARHWAEEPLPVDDEGSFVTEVDTTRTSNKPTNFRFKIPHTHQWVKMWEIESKVKHPDYSCDKSKNQCLHFKPGILLRCTVDGCDAKKELYE